MERRISVGIFRPKYVDHLQRWSWIFRSEETETNFSIWIPTEIFGIFGIMESTPDWLGLALKGNPLLKREALSKIKLPLSLLSLLTLFE